MIVVVIVVAVLYGAFYVGGMLIGNAIKNKMGLKNMQVNNDGKSFQFEGKNGEQVQVGENLKLPAGFPATMPMYPGAKIQSAIDMKEGMAVTYTVDNVTAEQLQDFYKTELPKNGWTNDVDKVGGGIFAVKNAQFNGMIIALAEKGKGHVQINIGPVKK